MKPKEFRRFVNRIARQAAGMDGSAVRAAESLMTEAQRMNPRIFIPVYHRATVIKYPELAGVDTWLAMGVRPNQSSLLVGCSIPSST